MTTDDDNTRPLPGSRLGEDPSVTRRRFLGLLAAAGTSLYLGACTGTRSAGTNAGAAAPPPTGTSAETTTSTSREQGERAKPLDAEPAPPTPALPGAAPEYAGSERVDADVCIVGGGAAGMAAATAAARLGVRTVLLETTFSLGGNVTLGLVAPDRIAYGGPPMVAGYFAELFTTLAHAGDAVYPSPASQYSVPYDPDALRREALRMAQEAGAEVRLGSTVTFVERTGRQILAVCALCQGEPLKVTAKLFLDCTGDGNLGFLAGHPYWLGDRNHKQIQGQTLIFHAAPVDFAELREYAKSHGSQINDWQVIGLRPIVKQLRKEQRLSRPGQDGLLINKKIAADTVSISGSEVYLSHLAPGGLAEISTALETQNYELVSGLRDLVPGFGRARLVRQAERPYLREGRRLVGLAQLTGQDVTAGRKAEDGIARGWYPIDLHVSYDLGPGHFGQPRNGDWYDIPYRAIVARDIDNLLMAGRCISATHEALGSARISPTSMAVGQAAGIAAAQAVTSASRPRDLDVGPLRDEIYAQGGML